MFQGYYKGRRVLVTGHTGFKGGWLSLWLKQLGASVSGLSLPAPTDPNLREILGSGLFAGEVQCDLRDRAGVAAAVKGLRPEVLFHLAAQPIVRRSYAEPLETLETNVVGTANVLEAVRQAGLSCVVVLITSDKCYENREWEFGYRENDPLGGHDVYSMSKAAAELVAQAWRKSFFEPDPNLGPMATARAGNVVGGGDYAQDRLVPDCIRALMDRKPIQVRNPSAVRPWQHVLESAGGYLLLGARLGIEGRKSALAGAFNFGPEPSARQPVSRVVQEILGIWPGEWNSAEAANAPHEARLLTLSIDRARARLGWFPCWDFQETIRRTVSWYHERHVRRNADMLGFSIGQIREYTDAARRKGLAWPGDK